ncbi:uncharacterized protein [Prorops nasuta]|uniref:uncharacterized protein n=1 Tax=Prorops nasuta TaxID=863751 RepID=UPI0034CD853D
MDFICTTDCEGEQNKPTISQVNKKKEYLPCVDGINGKKSKPTLSKNSDSSSDYSEKSSFNEEHQLLLNPLKDIENVVSAGFSLKNPDVSSISVNDFKNIMREIQSIKYETRLIRDDIKLLINKMEEYVVSNRPVGKSMDYSWMYENNIKWPLDTKEQFDNFDSLLHNDNIRGDFEAIIGFVIDSKTVLSKNVLAVIRKFLHQNLTTKFTCVKAVTGKYTLKPSKFYESIISKFITLLYKFNDIYRVIEP